MRNLTANCCQNGSRNGSNKHRQMVFHFIPKIIDKLNIYFWGTIRQLNIQFITAKLPVMLTLRHYLKIWVIVSVAVVAIMLENYCSLEMGFRGF